jgi:uncharacterized repeat protein (TIGR04076 family)
MEMFQLDLMVRSIRFALLSKRVMSIWWKKKVRCPEGFCNYAWKDIYSDVRVLALGGDHAPWVEKPKMISCCTDGIRPVSFTLMRVDD